MEVSATGIDVELAHVLTFRIVQRVATTEVEIAVILTIDVHRVISAHELHLPVVEGLRRRGVAHFHALEHEVVLRQVLAGGCPLDDVGLASLHRRHGSLARSRCEVQRQRAVRERGSAQRPHIHAVAFERTVCNRYVERQTQRVPVAVLPECAALQGDVGGMAVVGSDGCGVAVGIDAAVIEGDGGQVGHKGLAGDGDELVVEGAGVDEGGIGIVGEHLPVGNLHGAAGGVAAGADVVGGVGVAEGDVAGCDVDADGGGVELSAGDGDRKGGMDGFGVFAVGADGELTAQEGDVVG